MRNILSTLFILYGVFIFGQSPFPCEGKMFLSQHQHKSPTNLYNVVEKSQGYGLTQVQTYNNIVVNATGYNVIDGYIYCMGEYGSIYRLHSDGSYVSLGTTSNSRHLSCVAGEVDYSGVYIAQNRYRGTLLYYDVIGVLKKVAEISLYWNPSSGINTPFAEILTDIIVHPRNPNFLVSHQQSYRGNLSTRGYILLIDAELTSPTVGMVTPIFKVDPSIATNIGATFIDRNGQLLGFGSNEPNGGNQDRLFKIDLLNQSVIDIGSGPEASGIDGCSCPYTLDLVKIIDSAYADCDSTLVQYQFLLKNNASVAYSQFIIIDSLHSGSVFLSSSQTNVFFSSDHTSFSLEVPNIDPKETLSFTVQARIPNTALPFSNQACLKGLWQDSDARILSDDTTTLIPFDPTVLDTSMIDLSLSNTLAFDTIVKCPKDSIFIHDRWIKDTGSYSIITHDGLFCDSILKLQVRWRSPVTREDSIFLCTGDSFLFFDTLITSSGLFSQFSSSSSGCDSIYTLHAFFADSILVSVDAILCTTDTFFFKDKYFDQPGRYTLAVNGADCDTFFQIHLTSPPPISPKIDITHTCQDDSSGTLSFHPQSDFQSFAWTDGSLDSIRYHLPHGSYFLSIVDAFGCTSLHEAVIDQIPIPLIFIETDTADCHNDFHAMIDLHSPTENLQFQLNGGSLLTAGTYPVSANDSVQLIYYYEHCSEDTAFFIPLIDTVQFEITNQYFGRCGEEFQIQLNVLHPGKPAIRSFYLEGIDSVLMDSNSFSLSFSTFTSSEFKAVVVDTHGCVYTRNVAVNIDEDHSIYVPNVFSPNGDHINDVFHVYGSPCVKIIKQLHIFDRWGEKVFQASNFLPQEKGWDGSLHKEKMNPGVFTYFLEYETFSGATATKKGSVTLIK